MLLNPIIGSNNPDNLFGTDADDILLGRDGFDAISGGLGNDIGFGGNDSDYLTMGDGNDTAYGDDGDDFISGGDGDDRVFGNAGNDGLRAEAGQDTLYGGAGMDTLIAGASPTGGIQELFGGGGTDALFLSVDQNAVADGGTGDDRLFLSRIGNGAATADISVTLTGPGAGASDGTSTLSFVSMESISVVTGRGNDTVNAGDLADYIDVGGGANIVNALGGDDRVSYTADALNQIHCGDGNDTVHIIALRSTAITLQVSVTFAQDSLGSYIIAAENFELTGSALDDLARFGTGDDRFSGGLGNDRAAGGAGNDKLIGGGDNDSLSGGAGGDRLFGGTGDDTLSGGTGDDILEGWVGTDILFGGTGADRFRFSAIDTSASTVADFTAGTDRMLIHVGKTGSVIDMTGPLDPALLSFGTATGTHAQFVLIDDAGPASRLLYDSDGATAGGEITICTLDGDPVLTAADIWMYDSF